MSPGADGCEPSRDCPQCERLVAFRQASRAKCPDWHNAPVPSFGPFDARLLIVGLAPGLKGANRTGRPFTGDYAGDLLYETLVEYGFAEGVYRADPRDGLILRNCMITNAVRCVPPENKPTPAEIGQCRPYLSATLRDMPNLQVILVLGRIAHDSTLRTLSRRLAAHPFSHGARHELSPSLALFDSFHCSRYNTNTGRLTPAMFKSVFEAITAELAKR